jgi:ABC-type uncharacterized transport system ATPase subunit
LVEELIIIDRGKILFNGKQEDLEKKDRRTNHLILSFNRINENLIQYLVTKGLSYQMGKANEIIITTSLSKQEGKAIIASILTDLDDIELKRYSYQEGSAHEEIIKFLCYEEEY